MKNRRFKFLILFFLSFAILSGVVVYKYVIDRNNLITYRSELFRFKFKVDRGSEILYEGYKNGGTDLSIVIERPKNQGPDLFIPSRFDISVYTKDNELTKILSSDRCENHREVARDCGGSCDFVVVGGRDVEICPVCWVPEKSGHFSGKSLCIEKEGMLFDITSDYGSDIKDTDGEYATSEELRFKDDKYLIQIAETLSLTTDKNEDIKDFNSKALGVGFSYRAKTSFGDNILVKEEGSKITPYILGEDFSQGPYIDVVHYDTNQDVISAINDFIRKSEDLAEDDYMRVFNIQNDYGYLYNSEGELTTKPAKWESACPSKDDECISKHTSYFLYDKTKKGIFVYIYLDGNEDNTPIYSQYYTPWYHTIYFK